MITTKVRHDEDGLFIMHHHWVARPRQETRFSGGDTVTPRWPGGHFVIVAATGEAFGSDSREAWQIECPYWWHKTMGAELGVSKEMRARDRLRDPDRFTPGNPRSAPYAGNFSD